MKVTFEAESGSSHAIELAKADYMLSDLFGFRGFGTVFQLCLAESRSPGLHACMWERWFSALLFQMEMERDVLPFKYEVRNDTADRHGVVINQERWDFSVGNGECSLSQTLAYESIDANGLSGRGSRVIKWIDCRGQTTIETDHGPIKVSRRKVNYRFYDELPGLIQFLSDLPSDELVRGRPA